MIRFVKNMGHFGRYPYLLTVDERDIWKLGYGMTQTDDSYTEVKRKATVKRVRITRPSALAVGMIKAIRATLLAILSFVKREHSKEDTRVDNSEKRGHDHEAKNIKNYYSTDINPVLKILLELVLIIDQTLEWAPRAIFHGIRFVRHNNIGTVCSSSPPWSVHIVGYILKLVCRSNWIVDLRDPIFGIETREFGAKTSPWLIRMFYKILESIVMRGADVVICNCLELKEYYKEKYPRTRFEVIMNSFDPDDYKGLNAQEEPREIKNISHFGELYPMIRTPDAFLGALAKVLQKSPGLHDSVRIHFYGATYYTGSMSFLDLVKDLDIGSMIESHDYVPHDIVLQEMVSSDVLLLLQPHYSTNYQIPAKLYEYIAVRRPLLAVTPDGSATSRLIKEYDLGIVCDPTDAASLESAVVAAVNGELPLPNDEVVEQFSARNMTSKLVDIMNSLS